MRWKPTEENIAVKSFSSSFLASGRLYAEYYQPKYDNLENIIKSYSQGWRFIRDVLDKDIKIGVEKAIETDETTVTAWINQQLAALGINSLDE